MTESPYGLVHPDYALSKTIQIRRSEDAHNVDDTSPQQPEKGASIQSSVREGVVELLLLDKTELGAKSTKQRESFNFDDVDEAGGGREGFRLTRRDRTKKIVGLVGSAETEGGWRAGIRVFRWSAVLLALQEKWRRFDQTNIL